MKGYAGEITPIGQPCNCQYCQDCLNQGLGNFEFDDTGFCPNPECPTRYRKATKDNEGNVIKLGPSTEKEYYFMKHKGETIKCSCPGGQYFWRVLFSSAVDNPHIRADFIQSQSNSDARVNSLYVRGEPIDLNANNVFSSFSQLNVRDFNKPVDYEKDLFWSFDFNNRPQCSVVCQEVYKLSGELDYVDQLDEIILFDIREVLCTLGETERGASPEHVADEFMKRYPDFKKTIWMYGDPTAVNKSNGPLEKTKYQIIYDMLTKRGYNVKMTVKKRMHKDDPNRMIPIIDRVNNANWLFRNNTETIRFYINKKCEYTIMSLKDLKWDKSGAKPDKGNIDEYARRSMDIILDPYKRVLFVSHPADALTYYLFQKFPLIKTNEKALFLQIPGESTIFFKEGKLVEQESDLKKLVKLIKEDEKKEESLVDYLKQSMEMQSEADFFSGFFS